MDTKTLGVYDDKARDFATEWEEEQSAPDDLRAIFRQFFVPGPTVDVGCGSGRDTAWLAQNGFDVLGVDASTGLIEEACRRHPGVRFARDTLPDLATLQDGAFTNVLCETVIMHLAAEMIPQSVRRLVSLLAPGGVLYLTWRVTGGGDTRDDAGRLYASFDPSLVIDNLTGSDIVLNEQSVSASSGKVIHRIAARRRAQDASK